MGATFTKDVGFELTWSSYFGTLTKSYRKLCMSIKELTYTFKANTRLPFDVVFCNVKNPVINTSQSGYFEAYPTLQSGWKILKYNGEPYDPGTHDKKIFNKIGQKTETDCTITFMYETVTF